MNLPAEESQPNGAEAEDELQPSFTPDPLNLLKALLFASPEYIPLSTLKEILGTNDTVQIRTWLKTIQKELNQKGEPFEIQEINKSYLFRTKSEYYPWIKKLYRETGARKLSQAALEILALIAYKQPMTKAEIEEIRGVNVDGPLRGLLERKLIQITGKSDKIGSAFTYGTTKEFCQYFGISRVPEDLPKLSEFENLIAASNLVPQMAQDGQVIELKVDSLSEDEKILESQEAQRLLQETVPNLFSESEENPASYSSQLPFIEGEENTSVPSELSSSEPSSNMPTDFTDPSSHTSEEN